MPLAIGLLVGQSVATEVQAQAFDPQAAIAQSFPAMRDFRRATKPELAKLEARIDAEEQAGADRSCLRGAATELRWHLNSTADVGEAERARDKLRRLAAAANDPAGDVQDADGSYGPCVDTWFWKLDASTDRFLTEDAPPIAPRFLDQVNEPARLEAYLMGLLHSDPRRDGIDRRKELNLASADLVRLILRHRPRGYSWRTDLEPVIHRFVTAAQDPATGFFGERYQDGDREIRSQDLSVTFHMARYLAGDIPYWPLLIDHLIAMKHGQYPEGWLDSDGMTVHNDYDVVTLFRLGWPKLRADHRPAVAAEIQDLLDWCLNTALSPDGVPQTRAAGESWPDALYFTAAFLDEVGFLDPVKRYWTDHPLPDSARIRAGLIAQARKLPTGDPMAQAALERLGAE